MKKNQTKKINKNLVYVVLMISIAVSSVLSIFSMRKNVMTSLSEGNAQKIFSANSETIDTKEEKSEANKEEEKVEEKNTGNKKFVEKISFIKQDEKVETANEVENQKEAEIANQVENQKEAEIANQVENQKETKQDFDYDKQEVFFQSKDSFIVPIVGEIERDFSDDKLIYSKTLDEWRVHKGVDIVAKDGAVVKAVLDGYVEEIKEDEEYGMSVSIRHSKNLVSVYKSLSSDVLVLPNQIIKQGDTIGFVSNTAKIENSIGAHLHFEMLRKDKLVDPKIYIQFKKK